MLFNRFYKNEELHLVVEILGFVNEQTELKLVKDGDEVHLENFFSGFVRPDLPVELNNPWFEKVYRLLQSVNELTFYKVNETDRVVSLYRLYDGGWFVDDSRFKDLSVRFD